MPEFWSAKYLIVAAIIALAAFTQGTLGFAAGMVSMSLLPLVIASKVAVPLVSLCAVPLTCIILWQCRRAVRFRDVRLMVPGLLVAVPLGVYVLSALPDQLVRRIIGGLVVLTAAHMLLGRAGKHAHVHPAWAVAAGAGTGALGGAFNVGGAPMLFYFLAHDWDKDRIKGNFALLGTINIVSRLLLYRFDPMLHRPLLTDAILVGCLPLLAVVAVATLLGSLVYRLMDQVLFRRLVLTVLILLGLFLIVK
jgi:uncharacterized membrane protein YfcA